MRIRALHSAFGAEVLEFDVMAASSPSEIEALRDALDEYGFLLIRQDQRVPPERHVEIGGWFGPLMENNGAKWSVLNNEEAAGSIRLPFHSDFSYTTTPIKVISLHALEIPPGGSATAYVSNAHAWRTLDADRQARLSRLTLRHRHSSQITDAWPEFLAEHPVRLAHPRTGAPLLYVTEHHADRLCELEPAESERLLQELYAHIYAPQNVYVHQWRPYDLVIWDNLAVQHARPAIAEPAAGARVLQRVAVNEVSLPVMLERARRRQDAESRTQF